MMDATNNSSCAIGIASLRCSTIHAPNNSGYCWIACFSNLFVRLLLEWCSTAPGEFDRRGSCCCCLVTCNSVCFARKGRYGATLHSLLHQCSVSIELAITKHQCRFAV